MALSSPFVCLTGLTVDRSTLEIAEGRCWLLTQQLLLSSAQHMYVSGKQSAIGCTDSLSFYSASERLFSHRQLKALSKESSLTFVVMCSSSTPPTEPCVYTS